MNSPMRNGSSQGLEAFPKAAAAHAASSMRVAVVENDPDEAAVFSQWLKLAGHRTHHFSDGAALVRVLDQVALDALLLDWSLPSTLEVLRRVRGSDRASLPVLLVGGRSREDDVVTALRQGADDYVVKPVRRFELIARLEAVARRGRHRVEESIAIEAGALRIDCATRTVWRDGRPLAVTAKDFELSVLFLRNIGRLLSRGYLLDTVWGPNAGGLSRTLDTHISRLRKKLGLTPEYGWRLMPVYTRGYRLDQLSGIQFNSKADGADLRVSPLRGSRRSSGAERTVERSLAGVDPDRRSDWAEERVGRAGALSS
jgi:two-component system, OmpR family, response regulator RegX3